MSDTLWSAVTVCLLIVINLQIYLNKRVWKKMSKNCDFNHRGICGHVDAYMTECEQLGCSRCLMLND